MIFVLLLLSIRIVQLQLLYVKKKQKYIHQINVTTLNFMKQSNQLISGDFNGTILIWSSNNQNQWIRSQKVNGDRYSINSIILNNKEDLFISSGNDIKFWTMSCGEWIVQQTMKNHTRYVYQLSFNYQQNQVITCGKDRLISVIEYSEDSKKWILIQKIEVEVYGYRICFLNNEQCIFQPNYGNLMHVYEINSLSKKFTKTKNITLSQGGDENSPLFPSQFIESKQLLLNKHSHCINLIRRTEDGEFKIDSSIQFETNALVGHLSDDGEYLITWDQASKEISLKYFLKYPVIHFFVNFIQFTHYPCSKQIIILLFLPDVNELQFIRKILTSNMTFMFIFFERIKYLKLSSVIMN